MSVEYVRLQHFPCLKSILTALNVVSGVKHALQLGNILMDLKATGGNVAVDALLVLVAKRYAASLGSLNVLGKRTRSVQTSCSAQRNLRR